MILLFIGISGSGKDTQAQLISAQSSFQTVSTGALIRDIASGTTRIQSYIKKSMTEQFSSDDLVYGLLHVYMKYSRGNDFILTGAVRRFSQIARLDSMLASLNQQVDRVFFFDLDDDIAVERLNNRLVCKVCGKNYNLKTFPPKVEDICDMCGSIITKRKDDQPEAIQRRLQEFHKYNDEIIKYYEQKGLLEIIDASKSISEIQSELMLKIEDLLHI